MLKKTILAGIAIAGFALPQDARADSISFQGMGKSAVVTVAGARSGVFNAGELNWVWAGGAPAGFQEAFYTYCANLLSDLIDPQQVTVTSTSQMPSGAKLAWLVNSFAPLIRASGTGIQAAALQVALWEVIYDSTFDLTSGNFSLITAAGVYGGQQTALAIFGQASQYLNALSTAPYATSTAFWLFSNQGQSQILSVPEPAVLLLLGLGALAAGAFFRARQRAQVRVRTN